MTTMIDPKKMVLIIGASGFLGRHAVKHFYDRGWSVVGIDSVTPENAPLADLAAYYSLHLPASELDDLLKKSAPDLCVHCAGRASIGLSISDPLSDFQSGPVLTFNILNALRIHAPECRFLLLSSAAVYGNPSTLPVKETDVVAPISSYGFHKWQCEQLCLEFAKIYGLRTASLRIFSAYGTGLRRQVVWDICQKALTQREIFLQGTGRESRDFVHARDIARAAETVAILAPMRGETYNLASGREVTIAELAHMLLKALRIAAVPVFSGTLPPGTPLNWRGDISSLTRLGFTPSIGFEQGIRSVANWCREELSGE
jgi:UDP-glucose 4-epimerase